MIERSGAATMKGKPVTLVGPELKAGERAPEFECLNAKLDPVRLADFRGKIKLIASVPSLDTSVCNKMTIRFNDEAERLGSDQVEWVTVSMDLPFAQKRFVEDEDALAMNVISDHRDAYFGLAYGVLIKEMRLLNRAVFVIDRDDIIRHVEYLKENSEFPNFEAAVKVVMDLLGQVRRAAA